MCCSFDGGGGCRVEATRFLRVGAETRPLVSNRGSALLEPGASKLAARGGREPRAWEKRRSSANATRSRIGPHAARLSRMLRHLRACWQWGQTPRVGLWTQRARAASPRGRGLPTPKIPQGIVSAGPRGCVAAKQGLESPECARVRRCVCVRSSRRGEDLGCPRFPRAPGGSRMRGAQPTRAGSIGRRHRPAQQRAAIEDRHPPRVRWPRSSSPGE